LIFIKRKPNKRVKLKSVYQVNKSKISSEQFGNELVSSVLGEKRAGNTILGDQAVIQHQITPRINKPPHCFYKEKTGRVNAVFHAGTMQAFLFEYGIHFYKKDRYSSRHCLSAAGQNR